MACGAGVRTAGHQRQVGPWNAHAVIPAGIDPHVNLGRHMALDTLGAGTGDLVSVVGGVVIGAGQVALATDAVALGDQLVAVRVVAVGADHTRLVHLALDEGAVDIDFIPNLSVGPVQG